MKPDNVENVLALASIPELSELHPDDLAALADRAEEHCLAPGETLGSEEAARVCLLLEGTVETGEKERITGPALAGAVEALADAAFVPRAVDGEVRAVTVDRSDFSWILSDVFEIWLAVLRHTAKRWIAAEPSVADKVSVHRLVSGGEGVSLVPRIRMLSACTAFESLRIYPLARIASAMEEVRIEKGEELWECGNAASDAFLVIEGSFAFGTDSMGADPSVTEPGTLLGLQRLLAGMEHPDGAFATSESWVLRLRHENLIDELEDDPDAAAQFLEALAHRALRTAASNPEDAK